MKKTSLIIVLAVGLMVWLLPQEVFSTTLIHSPFKERLIHKASEHIVWGTLIDKTYYRDDKDRLRTKMTLKVHKTLKGEHQKQIEVIFYGGELPDGKRIEVAGMPKFEVGDEVIFLLVPQEYMEKRFWPFWGGWEGAFRILKDPKTGKKIACNHEGEPILGFDALTGELTVDSSAEKDKENNKNKKMKLNEFIHLIEKILQSNQTSYNEKKQDV